MKDTHSPLTQQLQGSFSCSPTTLLDLVWPLSQVTDDDNVVVTAAAALLNQGRIPLTGTFRTTWEIRL